MRNEKLKFENPKQNSHLRNEKFTFENSTWNFDAIKESRNSHLAEFLSGLKNQHLEFLQILDTYGPALKKIQMSILLNHPNIERWVKKARRSRRRSLRSALLHMVRYSIIIMNIKLARLLYCHQLWNFLVES